MRGTSLALVDLLGVRWSAHVHGAVGEATVWPEGWAERMLSRSVVVEPGIYEVIADEDPDRAGIFNPA